MFILCQYRGILFLLRHDGACVLVRILCLYYALPQRLSDPVVDLFHFKVQTLSATICTVLLHLSNFCLCSVADFLNTCKFSVLKNLLFIKKDKKT